jgi:hypothetical protein
MDPPEVLIGKENRQHMFMASTLFENAFVNRMKRLVLIRVVLDAMVLETKLTTPQIGSI